MQKRFIMKKHILKIFSLSLYLVLSCASSEASVCGRVTRIQQHKLKLITIYFDNMPSKFVSINLAATTATGQILGYKFLLDQARDSFNFKREICISSTRTGIATSDTMVD